MEAARLMIQARKLDLAAREWIGVRCLLLRRATTACGAAEAEVGAAGGEGGGACTETAHQNGKLATVASGGGLVGGAVGGGGGGGERAGGEVEEGGGRGGVAEGGRGGVAGGVQALSAGCSTLVLRPTTSAKGEADCVLTELDGVLEASLKGELVMETPEEAADVDNVGVGWGGWGSGGNQRVGCRITRAR